MDAPLYNWQGKEVGNVTLPEALFGVRWNGTLVEEVVRLMAQNRRRSTAHTKGRGDVSGGGKKPWRQKGTGRARHGSTRSPIWVGGGVTHGPTSEKIYERKINKNTRRKALAALLSRKLKEGEIVFVDSLAVASSKTKEAASGLKLFRETLGKEKLGSRGGRALILLEKPQTETIRAFRNLPYVSIEEIRNLNAEKAIIPKFLVITKEAVEQLKT